VCEFCLKHGDGKRWYLQAKNYGADLASDLRRQRFVKEFFADFKETAQRSLAGLERLRRTPPPLRGLIKRLVTWKMKRDHFGQVVPQEDVARIFELVNSVVRVPCVCREALRGRSVGYCFGLSIDGRFAYVGGLDRSYAAGPDGAGLERPSREEALALIQGFEKEGLLHSVWTFKTPFIGGLCNCDRSDCLAMRSLNGDLPVMFKAEYAAEIDWERCRGCRRCMRQCQFGAIGFSPLMKRCFIEARICYGCGICRAVCEEGAISLRERSPRAASLSH
jgi:ferredoxin